MYIHTHTLSLYCLITNRVKMGLPALLRTKKCFLCLLKLGCRSSEIHTHTKKKTHCHQSLKSLQIKKQDALPSSLYFVSCRGIADMTCASKAIKGKRKTAKVVITRAINLTNNQSKTCPMFCVISSPGMSSDDPVCVCV